MFALVGQDRRCRVGVTRRDVLRMGAWGFCGLTLADLMRLRTAGNESAGRQRSAILIWLRGGPSHIDSYDMKPAAPAEIRGEFASIPTNVPGIEVCEYMPLQAGIMDKLAIVRGIQSNDLGDHTPHYIMTGLPSRGIRPAVGSVVSYLNPRSDGLPAYVSEYTPETEGPTYLGPAHGAFVPRGPGLENLRPRDEWKVRMGDRRALLQRLDTVRRELDAEAFDGVDAFSAKAFEMVSSPRAAEAFNLNKEPAETRARYGRFWESFVLARRLVEAGVNVITLKIGDWDTHEHNFRDMRDQLPPLDMAMHALVTDLHERGLERDVMVVMWGEFGRAPRISRIAGRDHWPEAGAAVIAGGGLRMGQVIGATDSQAGRSLVKPYTPSNVIANVYRHLGIDAATTIADHQGRPMYLLDDRELVRELG